MSTWMIVRDSITGPTAGLRGKARETDRGSDGSERGGDEARELVAGVEPVVEQGHPRIARVVGVGEDGVDDAERHPSGQQDFGALHRMLRRGRVHFVVEVM